MAETNRSSRPNPFAPEPGLIGRFAALPEGWLIQKLFVLMAVASVAGLALDAGGYFDADPLDSPEDIAAPAPVDIPRPRPGDNLRPYRPGMIPRPEPTRKAEPSLPDGTPLPEPDTKRMRFSFDLDAAGVPFIVASGTLETGTAEEFSRFDQTHESQARYLFLVSHGGLVHEALAMGRHIRERAIKIVVPREGFCFSACPLVLAAGQERVVYPDAWIGLHQTYMAGQNKPTADEAFETGQRSVADIMFYLEAMDVDPLVWRFAIDTPPSQIHMLSMEDLLATKLATIVSKNIKLK